MLADILLWSQLRCDPQLAYCVRTLRLDHNPSPLSLTVTPTRLLPPPPGRHNYWIVPDDWPIDW